ncbi:MAG: hypothetical protein LC754_00680 [Acidobacteria bacterium]|nr:hypothetical protein [Acidobacteriota bacterium]
MKRPKRIAALLLAGFFVFAPPGTIILALVLTVGLIRHYFYPRAAQPTVQPTAMQTPTPTPTPTTPTPTPTPTSHQMPASATHPQR